MGYNGFAIGRTPFKTIQVPGEDGVDKVAAMKQTYYKLQLDCLVILGGNGTHTAAHGRVQSLAVPAAGQHSNSFHEQALLAVCRFLTGEEFFLPGRSSPGTWGISG